MSSRGFPFLLALVALMGFAASGARADIAATGVFDIQLALTSPNVPFTGSVAFDAGTRDVLGTPVNLAGAVGGMTFEGDAVVDVAGESASFDLTAESAGDFEFLASGAGSCESSGCVGGRGTFAGRLTDITDLAGLLPDAVYTFDGTAEISLLGQGPGGTFAINAFPLVQTAVGSAVPVSSGAQAFFDTVADAERSFVADALFETVSGAGVTEFVALSALPGAFPLGVNLNAMVAVFVDVATTATVAGTIRLCLGYPDANDDGIVDGTINNISETRLRLLHAAAVGAPFADVTVSVGDERVCGDVPALGPIVLGVLPEGATTTTSSTSTTTSVDPEASTTTSTSVDPGASTTTSTSTTSTTSSSIVPATSSTTSTTVTTTSTTVASPVGPTTTSTTLPVCADALECLDIAIAGPLCPGETLHQKLSTFILKKLAKAQRALLGSLSTEIPKKKAKLVTKARKQIDKIGIKADAFVSKNNNPISPECRDKIGTAIGRVTDQIEANRI